ncbi:MAG: hypothetical protein JWP01_547 [Myxococcales bacterium]|nr:hypothetical protein [Myxococcales bacterium]
MPDQSTAAGSGDVGATCQCGTQHAQDDCVAVACKPDLVCGYQCGIPGCDSRCMTQEYYNNLGPIP